MAFILRYNATGRLKMVHTGNTVGMSANSTYCATGITLDPNLDSNVGITSSFSIDTSAGTSNLGSFLGSWAYLNPNPKDVPIGSTVEKALLTIQSNSYQPTGNITLIDATSIAHTITLNWIDSNSGSADVTTIVANAGFGKYAVTSIAFAPRFDVHGIGWGILISYSHKSMPFRNISMFTGYLANGQSTTVSGFYAPSYGNVDARVFIQSVESNYFAPGDVLTLNGKILSGPYNPANNFFNNQICDYTGERTTIGSFAQYNVPQQIGPNPFTGPTYARDMFDITNVSGTNYLPNGSTSTTVAVGFQGDVLFIGMMGIEINANEAILKLDKYVDKSLTVPGDTLIYTLVLTNIGTAPAINPFVQDTLPAEVTFIPNSILVDGINFSGNIETGITLTSLPYLSAHTITFSAKINTNIPISSSIVNMAYSSTDFKANDVSEVYNTDTISNFVTTLLFQDTTTILKLADRAYVQQNDIITYTLIVKNPSPINTLSNITIYDTIPYSTQYINNSFFINTVQIPSANPELGVPLNILIPPLSVATATFKVKAIGTEGTIINDFNTNYNINTGVVTIANLSLLSNEVLTLYKYAIVSTEKSVDIGYATIGSTITYSIVITNKGNIITTNMIFNDTIPIGTKFINGSVFVNNINKPLDSPLSGISIGSIEPNNSTTITFKVIVV